MSAGSRCPEVVRTSSDPSAACSKPDAPSFSRMWTPCFSMMPLDVARHLAVERRHELVAALHEA